MSQPTANTADTFAKELEKVSSYMHDTGRILKDKFIR